MQQLMNALRMELEPEPLKLMEPSLLLKLLNLKRLDYVAKDQKEEVRKQLHVLLIMKLLLEPLLQNAKPLPSAHLQLVAMESELYNQNDSMITI